MDGSNVEFCSDAFVNIVRHGANLRVRCTFADDKEICGRIVEVSHIEQEDVFAFDVLQGINN